MKNTYFLTKQDEKATKYNVFLNNCNILIHDDLRKNMLDFPWRSVISAAVLPLVLCCQRDMLLQNIITFHSFHSFCL